MGNLMFPQRTIPEDQYPERRQNYLQYLVVAYMFCIVTVLCVHVSYCDRVMLTCFVLWECYVYMFCIVTELCVRVLYCDGVCIHVLYYDSVMCTCFVLW